MPDTVPSTPAAAQRPRRLVIIGAVAAGTSVGAKARRNDEQLEIVVYEPGAINIPLGELRQRVGELDPNTRTVTYCNKGVYGNAGQNILLRLGFRHGLQPLRRQQQLPEPPTLPTLPRFVEPGRARHRRDPQRSRTESLATSPRIGAWLGRPPTTQPQRASWADTRSRGSRKCHASPPVPTFRTLLRGPGTTASRPARGGTPSQRRFVRQPPPTPAS